MSDERTVFEAIHPAEATYVPSRGRAYRTEFVRTVSPVSVRRVDEEAFEPVPDWGMREPTFLHEGAFWYRVARGVSGTLPVSPESFQAALASAADLPAHLRDLARGTPLMAVGDVRSAGAPDDFSPVDRGAEVDLGASREVVRDGRPAAAAALARHMDAEYRFTGRHVYRRRVPLATCELGRASVVRVDAVRGWRVPGGLCAGPATYAAAMRLARARNGASQDGPTVEPWLRVAAAGVAPGEEHRAVANAWPGWMRRRLARSAGLEAPPDVRERLQALRPALMALEFASMTGRCGEDDLSGALRTMLEVERLLDRLGPFAGKVPRSLALEALENLYLPTLPEPALAEDDARALESLGPSR